MPIRMVSIFAASLLLVACSSQGDSVPATNAEHNAMLESLGFTTGLGPRVDPSGAPVADGDHPLRSRFATFRPSAELYLGGIVIGGAGEHLFDDGSHGYARLAFAGQQDTSWQGAKFKNGIAGDFDGDGVDEILVVYFEDAEKQLRFFLLDVATGGVKEGVIDTFTTAPANLDQVLQPALSAGDFDGDGNAEAAIGFSHLYLLDQIEGTPQATRIRLSGQDEDNDAFVAMGNVDWDAADELVVTFTRGGGRFGAYAIFDGNLVGPVQTGPLSHSGPDLDADQQPVPHVIVDAQVAIGDIDGDRIGEIVFGALESGADKPYWPLLILDYKGAGASALYEWTYWMRPAGHADVIPKPLIALDYDGDGLDEIYYANQIVSPRKAPFAVGDEGTYWNGRAAAGDVDGDGNDEIIVSTPYAVTGANQVYASGRDASGNWKLKNRWSGALIDPWSAVIVPANVDADSPVVRYDGEHELLFTEPTIIAVLASPPYKTGIGQNVAGTVTTFGQSHGETAEDETSLGFTVGGSVSIPGAKGSLEITAKVAQDYVSSHSSTIRKYASFTTGPGADKVVFTAVPFDVYYYTVTSSPDPAEVGRRLTINVPRENQILAATPDFFNAHNGGALDVDQSILAHKRGEVWSYPTLARRDELLDAAEALEGTYKRLWNGPFMVSEGTGFQTVGISESKGSGNGTKFDFNVEVKPNLKMLGVVVGVSVGFHHGHTYKVSSDDTTTYEGRIGDIPAESFTSQNLYRYGLFVYPAAVGAQKFVVMNYWTER